MKNRVQVQEHQGYLVFNPDNAPSPGPDGYLILGVPRMTGVTAKVLLGHLMSQSLRGLKGKRKLHIVPARNLDPDQLFLLLEGDYADAIPMSDIELQGPWSTYCNHPAAINEEKDPPISEAARAIIDAKTAAPKIEEPVKESEPFAVFFKGHGGLCYYRNGNIREKIRVYATSEAEATLAFARRTTAPKAVVGTTYRWAGDDFSTQEYFGTFPSDLVTVSNELAPQGSSLLLEQPPAHLLEIAELARVEEAEEQTSRRRRSGIVYDSNHDDGRISLVVHSVAGELFFKIETTYPAVDLDLNNPKQVYKFRPGKFTYTKEALITLRELAGDPATVDAGPLRLRSGVVEFEPSKLFGTTTKLLDRNMIHWSRIELGTLALDELRRAVFSGHQAQYVYDFENLPKPRGTVRLPDNIKFGEANMILPYRNGYVYLQGYGVPKTNRKVDVVVYADEFDGVESAQHLISKPICDEPSGIVVPGHPLSKRIGQPSAHANVPTTPWSLRKLSDLSSFELFELERAYHNFEGATGWARQGEGPCAKMLLVSAAGRIDQWDHHVQNWIEDRLRDSVATMPYAQANQEVLRDCTSGLYIHEDGTLEALGSPNPQKDQVLALSPRAPIYREHSRVLPAPLYTAAPKSHDISPMLGFTAVIEQEGKALVTTRAKGFARIPVAYIDDALIEEIEAAFVHNTRAPRDVQLNGPVLEVLAASDGAVFIHLVIPKGCEVGGWSEPLPVIVDSSPSRPLRREALHAHRASDSLRSALMAREVKTIEKKEEKEQVKSETRQAQVMELRHHFEKRGTSAPIESGMVAFENHTRLFWDNYHDIFWVIWSSIVAKHDNNLYLAGRLSKETSEKIKGLPRLSEDSADKAQLIINGDNLWVRRKFHQGDYDVLINPGVYIDNGSGYAEEHILEEYEKHEALKEEHEKLKKKLAAQGHEDDVEPGGLEPKQVAEPVLGSSKTAEQKLIDHFKDQLEKIRPAFEKGRALLSDAPLVKDDSNVLGDLRSIMAPADQILLLSAWIELQCGWKGFPAFALRQIAQGEVVTFPNTTFGDPDDNRKLADMLEGFSEAEELQLVHDFIETMDLNEDLRRYLIAKVENPDDSDNNDNNDNNDNEE